MANPAVEPEGGKRPTSVIYRDQLTSMDRIYED